MHLYQILNWHVYDTVTRYPVLIQLPERTSPKMIHCLPAESSFINGTFLKTLSSGKLLCWYKQRGVQGSCFPMGTLLHFRVWFSKTTSYETSHFFRVLDAEHLRASRLTLNHSEELYIWFYTVSTRFFSPFIFHGKIYLTNSLFSSSEVQTQIFSDLHSHG